MLLCIGIRWELTRNYKKALIDKCRIVFSMSSLKKIDADSRSACQSSLNLFTVPSTSVSAVKAQYREILPISTVTQEGPYTFQLKSDSLWLDMSRCLLFLELKVEKKADDGTWVPLTDTEPDKHVSLTNNVVGSFVKQMQITVNGVDVFDSTPLYPYRAYITKELAYSHEVKLCLHAISGYTRDSNTNQADHTGSAYKKRAAMIAKSKVLQVMDRLDFDLANQDLLLLNNSDIVFKLYRSSDDFLLLAPEGNTNTYRINVLNVRMFVKLVELNPSVNVAIMQKLMTTPAKYATRKVEMRSVPIDKGRREFTHNIFTSILPRRVIICLVDSRAYTGTKSLSPFQADNFDVETISIEVNGQPHPAAPYALDFENDRFARAFVDLYEGLGILTANKTVGIDPERFKKGHCFFNFLLTSTMEDSTEFEVVKSGSTAVKIRFKKDVPDQGIEMIVYAEFDSLVSISADRVVKSDNVA